MGRGRVFFGVLIDGDSTLQYNGRLLLISPWGGQRLESSFGLYFYNARWSPGKAPGTGDPAAGRFIQADSVVPGGVQGLDRYAYVNNNPLKYTDPSGHIAREDSFYGCRGAANTSRIDGSLSYWKWAIKSEFGISLVDTGSSHGHGTGAKAWDLESVRQVGYALGIANDAINGKLKSLIGGSIFTLNNYTEKQYHGWTGEDPYTHITYIDFETGSSFPSPFINIFHEVGHLIDVNSAGGNHYSQDLASQNRNWITEGKVDVNVLLNPKVSDPYWIHGQDALQGGNHTGTGLDEQWADTFANYVAGNIKSPEGDDMNKFVSGYFYP
jgi:RHS repeat-associated protein